MLFLGHLLARALEASREVVKNFEELEELLRINWSNSGGCDAERKWQFVRETTGSGVVNRVARRILLAKGGERCLAIVKGFYRKFYSKEDFRKVIDETKKEIVWKRAATDILKLKADVDPVVRNCLESLEKVEDFRSDDPKEAIKQAFQFDLPTLAVWANSGSVSNISLCKALAGITIHLQTGDREYLQQQLLAIRKITTDLYSMERYQNLMEFQPFYEVNVELLKTHHQNLRQKELLYDSNTILLCHLIYGKSQMAQFLEDFLNETYLGGANNLELILAELQNFK
ncbi:uncharacterized protein LOC131695631 [Topomyia yanbarensis]|uniref:uncharacterized protein LOC131695631 n=1 Tax=Topomyia yanbarensis TaxID=2498891 RepID=UPI00273CEAA8|nr:uncharacterized protein LOC131695631 [Topomyia yanbarensis]